MVSYERILVGRSELLLFQLKTSFGILVIGEHWVFKSWLKSTEDVRFFVGVIVWFQDTDYSFSKPSLPIVLIRAKTYGMLTLNIFDCISHLQPH